jgi:hypothetical protein
MEKIFTDANIVRGLIIVSSPQSSSKIISDLVTQFDASLYTYTEESEALDEATKSKFFEIYNLPTESRKYSVIHTNRAHLANQGDLFEPLIAESRMLKLIFVIEIENLSALGEDLRNLLFGNIDNFIVGDLSESEKELFNKFTNNRFL